MKDNVNFNNLIVEKVDGITSESEWNNDVLISKSKKLILNLVCKDITDGSIHKVNMTINEPKSFQFEIID